MEGENEAVEMWDKFLCVACAQSFMVRQGYESKYRLQCPKCGHRSVKKIKQVEVEH